MTTSSLMQTYARSDLAFERGEGVWLIAADGRRYMDCASGIAVSGLGHAHPKLVEASSLRPKSFGTSPTSTLFQRVRSWQSG